jgi:hypothetical protein
MGKTYIRKNFKIMCPIALAVFLVTVSQFLRGISHGLLTVKLNMEVS